MPEPRILALDLGTKFGWAHQDEGGRISWGTEKLVRHKARPGGVFSDFSHWLAVRLSKGLPEAVVIENVRRHSSTLAAHAFGGYRAVVMMRCESLAIPLYQLEVPRIKKVASGKGSASKTEMIESVRNLGFAVDDDDEADAVAILYTYRQTRKLETT